MCTAGRGLVDVGRHGADGQRPDGSGVGATGARADEDQHEGEAGLMRPKELLRAGRTVRLVLVFKVVGRGDTALVFALTRGGASPKAIKSATHKIHSH
jgi:hypothetical protein